MFEERKVLMEAEIAHMNRAFEEDISQKLVI